MDKDERIEKLLDALEKAQEGMDAVTFWPCHAPQIEAYFSHIFALNLFNKFCKDRQKFKNGLGKVRVDILRNLFYSSGIIGLKVANKFEGYNIPTKDITDFALCILDVIKKRSLGDEYCLDSKNLLLSKTETVRILKLNSWQKPRELEEKRKIAHLIVDTEALVWSLFYDIFRQGGVEVHGPYKTPKGALLVRNFYDLNPPIWKFKNKYQQIKMYLLYDSSVEIAIDFANHPIYKNPILEELKEFLIIVDNKSVGMGEVEEIDDYFVNLRGKQVRYIESLPVLKIIKKGIEIYYYLMKDFFDFYKEDWHPPKEVDNNIKRFGLRYWKRYKPTKKEETSVFRKLYDPRIEWVR